MQIGGKKWIERSNGSADRKVEVVNWKDKKRKSLEGKGHRARKGADRSKESYSPRPGRSKRHRRAGHTAQSSWSLGRFGRYFLIRLCFNERK
jgi:hypothetical protein